VAVPRRVARALWCAVQIFAGVFLLPAGNGIWTAYHEAHGNAVWIWAAKWWVLFSLAAIAVPIIGEAYRHRLFAKRRCDGAIKRLLAGLSDCYPQPNRTNIMLVHQVGNRRRRRVEKHTAHNMAHDPDNELEIDIFAGVSGQAMRKKAYVWGDLTIADRPGAPSWGLLSDEQGRVRSSLKTIVSVPIVDFEDPDGEPMGTLQVDSDLDVKEFLPDEAAGGRLASRFADVVALLLKERG
jgi:hypothetical protein